jgi:hypothetical protein
MSLMPSDIVEPVYQVIANANPGSKGDRPNWITAYQILARLTPELRRQLVNERGRAGKGSGHQYAASSAVANACQILAKRGRIDIDYLDAQGVRFMIERKWLDPGDMACGIYRVK